MNLDSVFSIRVSRTVSADYRVRWEGEIYRIEREQITAGMRDPGCKWSYGATEATGALRDDSMRQEFGDRRAFSTRICPFSHAFVQTRSTRIIQSILESISRHVWGFSSNRSASKMCLRTISVRVLNFCDVSLSDCCYSATTTRRRLERAAMRNCQATAGHLRISANAREKAR